MRQISHHLKESFLTQLWVRDSFGTLRGEIEDFTVKFTIIIILIVHWIGACVIGAASASAVTCRRLSSSWVLFFLPAAGIPAIALAFVFAFTGFSSPA